MSMPHNDLITWMLSGPGCQLALDEDHFSPVHTSWLFGEPLSAVGAAAQLNSGRASCFWILTVIARRLFKDYNSRG
jgi:hypothetical protein